MTLLFRRALDTIESGLGIQGTGRVSLHSLNIAGGMFTVADSVGDTLLPSGSNLPIEAATQILVPARGSVFVGDQLADDPSFDHELDRLIKQMGFHSSCSVPLLLGRSPVGVVCISSRERTLKQSQVVGCVETVGSELTLGLCSGTATTATAPIALICYRDPIVADWVQRVLDDNFGFQSMLFDTADAAVSFANDNHDTVGLVVCESYFAGGALRDLVHRMRSTEVIAPVLVVASSDSLLSAELASQSGGDAYVVRKDGLHGIVAAIESLGTGVRQGIGRSDGYTANNLTRRECSLLLCLEEGKTFTQIARELTISVATAKGYARSLFGKFHAHSRAETVFEARRQGVIDFLREGGDANFATAAVRHTR